MGRVHACNAGLSRVIKLHKTHRTTNTVGTLSHMPPELLRYGHMSTAVVRVERACAGFACNRPQQLFSRVRCLPAPARTCMRSA